jgi:hypothetical protein
MKQNSFFYYSFLFSLIKQQKARLCLFATAAESAVTMAYSHLHARLCLVALMAHGVLLTVWTPDDWGVGLTCLPTAGKSSAAAV